MSFHTPQEALKEVHLDVITYKVPVKRVNEEILILEDKREFSKREAVVLDNLLKVTGFTQEIDGKNSLQKAVLKSSPEKTFILLKYIQSKDSEVFIPKYTLLEKIKRAFNSLFNN